MDKKKKRLICDIISYVVIITVVLLIKIFIVSPIKVNGDSMYNTLEDKDIMLLNEISYHFKDIKRHDIVVIKKDKDLLIKRVIGLPGEVIECKNGKIFIDGKEIKEKYVYSKTLDFEPVKLGKDDYFVMGDNRGVSLDSRVFGPFNRKDIKGKASFTLYPFNRFGKKE